MNLFEQWIAALESNAVAQSHHRMKDNDSFCALGLLCNLYDPNGWDTNGKLWAQTFEGHMIHPPVKVLVAAGLPQASLHAICHWNDRERRTFPEIAKLVLEAMASPNQKHAWDTI